MTLPTIAPAMMAISALPGILGRNNTSTRYPAADAITLEKGQDQERETDDAGTAGGEAVHSVGQVDRVAGAGQDDGAENDEHRRRQGPGEILEEWEIERMAVRVLAVKIGEI